MGAFDIVVTIPVAGVGLHETDAFLDEASREKAFSPEVIGVGIANAISVEGSLLLFFEIEEVRHFRLHAVGEFVGGHTCTEIAPIWAVFQVGTIEFCEEMEVGALAFTGHSFGSIEIENGTAGWAERGALEVGRQESIRPIDRATLRVSGAREDDEARKVFVEGAEPVGDPCSDAGIASELVAGIELVAGGGMVDRVDLGAAIEADVIDPFLKMDPLGGDVGSAFPCLDEIEGALDKVAFSGRHRAFHFATSFEALHVALCEFGLGVKGVDVGRATFHHQENTAFGFRWMVDDPGVGALKEGRERDRTKPCAEAIERFPACGVGVKVGSIVHRILRGSRSRELHRSGV